MSHATITAEMIRSAATSAAATEQDVRRAVLGMPADNRDRILAALAAAGADTGFLRAVAAKHKTFTPVERTI